MKRTIALLFALVFLLSACAPAPQQGTAPTESPTIPTEQGSPSSLTADDLIRYFNEVCLDAEFTNQGDVTLLQKWAQPIVYRIHGEPTDDDLQVLTDFCQWLNTLEGFPGISPAKEDELDNMTIFFCTQQDFLGILGDKFAGMDGGVTIWFDNNQINRATICYRTDLDQHVRNSVILEELYNSLGPMQDTALRPDSIIFSGYSTPQALTPIDQRILQLLYHPSLTCGMDAAQCEAAIRQLWQTKNS
jgi:hypothetical protein